MDVHTNGQFLIKYVPRSDWDLKGRKRGVYLGPGSFKALVPHHTVTGYVEAYFELVVEKMRYLQTLRPDLGEDIPYNWVLFGAKNPNEVWIAEGRGLGWTGAHTYGYNDTTHAAAFWGNSNVDPLTPGILEGFRFCGRLMMARNPTLDHGSYPQQKTSCAGHKIRESLFALQPPFLSLDEPDLTPTFKKDVELQFHRRLGSFFWDVTTPQIGGGEIRVKHGPDGDTVAFDCFNTETNDRVTVSLKEPGNVNVSILESNGAQSVRNLQWLPDQGVGHVPVTFLIANGGLTSVLCHSSQADLIRVEGRG